MITEEDLREYLRLPPDCSDKTLDLCIEAAKAQTQAAGIPELKNNAQYDLYMLALAACHYDNRGLQYQGVGRSASVEAENIIKMMNLFTLQLRYSDEQESESGRDENSGDSGSSEPGSQ